MENLAFYNPPPQIKAGWMDLICPPPPSCRNRVWWFVSPDWLWAKQGSDFHPQLGGSRLLSESPTKLILAGLSRKLIFHPPRGGRRQCFQLSYHGSHEGIQQGARMPHQPATTRLTEVRQASWHSAFSLTPVSAGYQREMSLHLHSATMKVNKVVLRGTSWHSIPCTPLCQQSLVGS